MNQIIQIELSGLSTCNLFTFNILSRLEYLNGGRLANITIAPFAFTEALFTAISSPNTRLLLPTLYQTQGWLDSFDPAHPGSGSLHPTADHMDSSARVSLLLFKLSVYDQGTFDRGRVLWMNRGSYQITIIINSVQPKTRVSFLLLVPELAHKPQSAQMNRRVSWT